MTDTTPQPATAEAREELARLAGSRTYDALIAYARDRAAGASSATGDGGEWFEAQYRRLFLPRIGGRT